MVPAAALWTPTTSAQRPRSLGHCPPTTQWWQGWLAHAGLLPRGNSSARPRFSQNCAVGRDASSSVLLAPSPSADVRPASWPAALWASPLPPSFTDLPINLWNLTVLGDLVSAFGRPKVTQPARCRLPEGRDTGVSFSTISRTRQTAGA